MPWRQINAAWCWSRERQDAAATRPKFHKMAALRWSRSQVREKPKRMTIKPRRRLQTFVRRARIQCENVGFWKMPMTSRRKIIDEIQTTWEHVPRTRWARSVCETWIKNYDDDDAAQTAREHVASARRVRKPRFAKTWTVEIRQSSTIWRLAVQCLYVVKWFFYLDYASLNDVEGVDRWLDCRGKVVLEILRYLLICFQRRKSPVSEPADSCSLWGCVSRYI